MPRLLWIGDAVVQTGFARVTHNVVGALHAADWDVSVLGLCYDGDPHPYPYRIYPAKARGGSFHGFHRVAEICERERPDVIVALNDAWVVAEYQAKAPADVPVVGNVPIDGELGFPYGDWLNRLAHVIVYTAFGEAQLRRTGYTGPASVVPHGVDLDTYRPMDRAEARALMGIDAILPAEALVLLNVNRNQWRKRLDLTLETFAALVEWAADLPLYLVLHTRPKETAGWDLDELVRYHGLTGRVGISSPDTDHGPASEAWLRAVYASADLQFSTTLGEGWGLTTMEGMACGIANVVPTGAALDEWPGDAVARVATTSRFAATGCVNNIYGVVDPRHMAATLEPLMRDVEARDRLAAAGLARVSEPQFRWPAIAQQFDAILRGVIAGEAVPA